MVADFTNFSIFHQNIQSLNSNSLNLVSEIKRVNFNYDAVILTETWRINLNFYTNLIQGYSFEYKPSINRAGGIEIYVRNEYSFNIIKSENLLARDILILNFQRKAKLP